MIHNIPMNALLFDSIGCILISKQFKKETYSMESIPYSTFSRMNDSIFEG